jgi:hypothetical protein
MKRDISLDLSIYPSIDRMIYLCIYPPMCIYEYINLPIYVRTYLYIYIFLSMYLSINLSIYKSIYQFFYLSSYLSIYVYIYPHTYLSTYLPLNLSIVLSICVSLYVPAYLCAYIYLSNYPPAYLCIYRSIYMSCSSSKNIGHSPHTSIWPYSARPFWIGSKFARWIWLHLRLSVARCWLGGLFLWNPESSTQGRHD